MARGGKREGAGRPEGALTKRTRDVAERAMATGKTPLEVMLDNMRHFQQVALDAEAVIEGLTTQEMTGVEVSPDEQFKSLLAQVKKAAGLRQMAHECARDAAPFLHPRLNAVSHTGQDGGPVELVVTEIRRTIVDPKHRDGQGLPAAAEASTV
jgi:hypothetical protein